MTEILLSKALTDYADRLLQALRDTSQCAIPEWNGSLLLGLRAHLMEFKLTPMTSANGSCHLMRCQDGRWIALNLSRATDWELLPALFQKNISLHTPDEIRHLSIDHSVQTLVEQGRLLGLAIASVPDTNILPALANASPATVIVQGKPPAPNRKSFSVLDLSSLWAGPLCSHLLQQCGAKVITIESLQRPDGSRLNSQTGAKKFYEKLHHHKQHHILDFTSSHDIQQLKQLMQEADVVIEGSRPRALKQLGLDAEVMVQASSGKIWISITGYGRALPQGNWIAYGDDAAAAAGLIKWQNDTPMFIGDAIADPLTGLHAALAAYRHWREGKSALLDVNLHATACRVAATAGANYL